MTRPASAASPSRATTVNRPIDERRILGRYGDDVDGPLVLCVAGIHGNEPSGVHAVRRVIAQLTELQPAFRGRFLAVSGNRPALQAGRRFIERDLNRGWNVRRVSRTLERPETVEDEEQAALLEILVPAIREAAGPVYLLDLHTTSSASPPFLTLGDSLRTRMFARKLGMPLVLGIEEKIDAMVDYLAEFGTVGVGIEAGQHEDPRSVDLHEAGLWLSLAAAGCLQEGTEVVDLGACRTEIREARNGLSRVFEVIYRRAINPEDGFRMTPGFANFTAVRAGQIVAHDARGPVPTPMRGRLFLPLYQAQGDDGYFLVRSISPFWLRVSAVLRRLGAPKLLPLLPGVHRSERREDTFVVSRTVARWLVNEIFHLLGYRLVRETRRHVVFRGRKPRLREQTEPTD